MAIIPHQDAQHAPRSTQRKGLREVVLHGVLADPELYEEEEETEVRAPTTVPPPSRRKERLPPVVKASWWVWVGEDNDPKFEGPFTASQVMQWQMDNGIEASDTYLYTNEILGTTDWLLMSATDLPVLSRLTWLKF